MSSCWSGQIQKPSERSIMEFKIYILTIPCVCLLNISDIRVENIKLFLGDIHHNSQTTDHVGLGASRQDDDNFHALWNF